MIRTIRLKLGGKTSTLISESSKKTIITNFHKLNRDLHTRELFETVGSFKKERKTSRVRLKGTEMGGSTTMEMRTGHMNSS